MEIRRFAVLAALSLGVIGLTACDGEGVPSLTRPDATDSPAPTDAPVVTETPVVTEAPVVTETPVVTEAPVVTDAPVATDAPETDDGDDGGVPAWLIPVIVIGGLVLVTAVALASRRRSRDDVARGTGGRREAHAMAAWIHDQLSLEILALPAADGARRWATERSRLDQLAIDARAFAAAGDPELWNQLVVIMQTLSSSIDTAVRLRSTEGADAQMADEAVAIANRHRAELGGWVERARPFV